MSVDLAERVHNHNYRLDPFVRSLLDTDFYKLLMAYYVWRWHPEVVVTFTLKIRTRGVALQDIASEEDLRAQLDHVRSLRFTNTELVWLQGNTFYGQKNIFPPEFIAHLRDLRLPDYDLRRDEAGDLSLSFTGPWGAVMFWEVPGLAIVNEARARAAMAGMSRYELRVLYASATTKLVGKLKSLKEAGVPRISEFGTRRRHGFLWQEFVIEAMREELGENFFGTSNALHAMRQGIEAVGTNAHELPMVTAALARIAARSEAYPLEDLHKHEARARDALFASQYEVLRRWESTFRGNLLVALPDTFGSTQFLNNALENFPQIRNWSGFRIDSKEPMDAACEIMNFWDTAGVNPEEKLMLFSDGLDDGDMIYLHRLFGDYHKVRDAYGWGTLATNDFRGCDPRQGSVLNPFSEFSGPSVSRANPLDPISVVCKVTEVSTTEGRVSAVKLSDNYEKATGDAGEIAAYREVFGTEGVANAPVIV